MEKDKKLEEQKKDMLEVEQNQFHIFAEETQQKDFQPIMELNVYPSGVTTPMSKKL